MTTLNNNYVTTLHIIYEFGDEFLLTDTLLNIYGQLRYRKTRIFGTRMRKVHVDGNFPISVGDDMHDLFQRLQQATHPSGTVVYNITKETRTNALIGIIPSGDRNALQQQLIDWENERGWKRQTDLVGGNPPGP